MVKKICPKCGKASYSASTRGKWVCPHCGADLSDVVALPLSDEDRR